MGLVSFLPPVRRSIPHEPGEWMEFRKPPGPVVRAARKAVESEGRVAIRDFGPDMMRAFMTGDDDDRAVRRVKKLEAASEYDVANFDRDTLLNYAIGDWSYQHNGEPVEVSRDTIALLDEPTARWAHETVVGLLTPPTQEDTKSAAPGDSPGA